MPLQATSGAASYDAFGGGAAAAPNYIEDVFSTFVYSGDSTYPRTITNGIDLSTKGGLIWFKIRSGGGSHNLVDTARGREYSLQINTGNAQIGPASAGNDLSSFNTNGFTLGTPVNWGANTSGSTYVSWTFRKQAKFFDVLTYTGNGAGQGVRAISHGLTSTPGCIIIKRTDITSEWAVWHRYAGVTNQDLSGISLNGTGAAIGYPNGTTALMNSTSFDPANIYGVDGIGSNVNGATYVAYLFAHNGGGFGLLGTDNVISCGNFTTDVSGGATINLGYEPQWFLCRKVDGAGSDWELADVMRKFTVGTGNSNLLYPNGSSGEAINQSLFSPTSTGVTAPTNPFESSVQYIYIAIRRGPMKVPTVGTSVYKAITYTGTGSANTVTGVGFAPDFVMGQARTRANGTTFKDRLRGSTVHLYPSSDNAEGTGDSTAITSFDMNGISLGTDAVTGSFNESGTDYVTQFFKRSPSFFDEVCYTGTGSATTFSHNLQAVPELMIVKNRSSTANWMVYVQAVGNQDALYLNGNFTPGTNTWWNNTTPTASVFTVGTTAATNASGSNFVAYLFATCAGVSKVGSYTGTATTKQIDCGFTGGARFVLIKRTDSTGDWYVWDSARGIVSGNDPYLFLNTSAVEVTNTDYIDTYSAGFEISSTAPAAINASAGTFVFLAVA